MESQGHTDARGLNRSIQAVWPSLAIKVHLAQLGTFRSTVNHGLTELRDESEIKSPDHRSSLEPREPVWLAACEAVNGGTGPW